MVARALDKLKPDAVLIEGPPDAADMIRFVAHKEMKPPVALLVYEPDAPETAVYYPFAAFSPEWQGLSWGVRNKATVRFIDLPQSLRPRREDPGGATAEPDGKPGHAVPAGAAAPAAPGGGGAEAEGDAADESCLDVDERLDPLDALAQAAGFSDGEAWWGKLVEERRGDDDPSGVFDAIREAMHAARAELGHTRHDPEEPRREAHMRRCIREAQKEGSERIVVICGAWHAPVLTEDALKASTKADDELLKGLTQRKITSTWIPWTYEQLSMWSGYGAGVHSPGWYEHLWIHHEQLSERWLTRVARLMRDEDLDASPASVIESVRLAECLASMRGRSIAGLEELEEATLSTLCHGNTLPMRVIERKLIVGIRLGEVPSEAPALPLQKDLAAQQKSLRLKVSADDTDLDLDQRKDMDLERSRLLHRLCILDIPWGTLAHDQRQGTSTFHEVWKLQWSPDLAVKVIEAARWGNTVAEAALGKIRRRAREAKDLAELATLLDHAMLANLPRAVQTLVERVQELSAVGSDVGGLMDAVPPLARVLRYGNVRKTDAAMVAPVVAGLVARVCAGLLPACGSLDDDAAAAMRDRINGVEDALTTLANAPLLDQWRTALRRLGDADVHGLVVGRCWRLLHDAHAAEPDMVETRLSMGLSRGNDPGKASAWLEGFLAGSGMVLIHDEQLLRLVDEWVCSLTTEAFEATCPIARRTFSTFDPPERRQIGERLKRGTIAPGPAGGAGAATDDYDPVRGALVAPVLDLILGARGKDGTP